MTQSLFPMPPNYGPGGAANADSELIPIQVKNALSRDTFPGHVAIEKEMHNLKVAGAWMDKSLGDTLAYIDDEKKKLMKEVMTYVHLQLVATTAGLPPPACVPSSIIDIIVFVKKVMEFIQELLDLAQALRNTIMYLLSIIQRIQAFLQRILNAIATLINDICNFHLPALPSLPNLFGDIHFDGFKFTKGMFDFQLKFDTHFAFGNCKLQNLVGNNPLQQALQNWIQAAPIVVNPSGAVASSMTNQNSFLFNPPLPSGTVYGSSPKSLVLNDPTKTTPVFSATFSPTTDFAGALVRPSAIVSNYAMPVSVFAQQVLSLLGNAGGIIADQNAPGVVGSGGVSGGGTTPVDASAVPYAQFTAPVRAYCQTNVSLLNIETTSHLWTVLNPEDPSVTSAPAWAVAWAWLTLMNQCRKASPTAVDPLTIPIPGSTPLVRSSIPGRGGDAWIPQFQAVFHEFVAATAAGDACFSDLNTPIPWNAYDPTSSTPGTPSSTPVIGPAAMAFFTRITSFDAATRGQVLWMLSYLEASLLGYTRCTTWDAYAPGGTSAPAVPHPLAPTFLTGPTGGDLDYLPLPEPAHTSPVIMKLSSDGRANYPSSISVPDYLVPVLTRVIGWSEASILNDPDYVSNQSRSMYVFTAEATAIAINSYSQFWRDFTANWASLLTLPVDLRNIVLNYPKVLSAYLHPRSAGAPNQGVGVLLDPHNPYLVLKNDYESRSKPFLYHYEDPLTPDTETLWAPGWPWLRTPSIPQMYIVVPTHADPANPQAPYYGQLDAFGSPIYAFPQFTETDPHADGWDRVPDPDDSTKTILSGFNRAAYFARKDIQALPYTEQLALADFNQAFDEVVNTGAALLTDSQDSLNGCYASLADIDTQIASLEAMATTLKDADGVTPILDAHGNPVPIMIPLDLPHASDPSQPVPLVFPTSTTVSMYAGNPQPPAQAPDPYAAPDMSAPVFQAPQQDPASGSAIAKAARLLRARKQILAMVPPPA